MGEVQEAELNITVHESKEEKSEDHLEPVTQPPEVPQRRDLNSWIRVAICCIFAIFGQAAAVILGRLYFTKGVSKGFWMETLVQVIGFPALLPIYFFLPRKKGDEANDASTPRPSFLKVASIYTVVGLLFASSAILLSLGLLYLPVTTYSLILASQLAFNAVFCFFLNGQKFTPYIVNSLVVITISSVVLVFQNQDSATANVSKSKYAIGFICTVAASAAGGLSFALIQLIFQKVLKAQNFKLILDYVIFMCSVASVVLTIGLFASGDWRRLTKEMDGFGMGRVSYLMNLIWSALLWQSFLIGCVGLTLEVGPLFANVVTTFALPVTPVLAVIFLHDKMSGLKVVALLLAIWGFVSYAYQQYIDEFEATPKVQDLTPGAPENS
ncbi:hypothetical protein Ancab_018311 [Ancistrocladus abbreviatus]